MVNIHSTWLVVIMDKCTKLNKSGKDKTLEPSTTTINRKYHQALVILVANLNLISQGQSPGISGIVLPQLWNEDSTDTINVSRELGAWFGKEKKHIHFCFFLVI